MSHEKHVSESAYERGRAWQSHVTWINHVSHTHTCWLQAKPAHIDHHGNSRCLWYDTACQKRPMCLKRALQKRYVYMKRETTPIIMEIRDACGMTQHVKRDQCVWKEPFKRDMYTWKERPHRSSRKFKMPAVLHSMSKETNLYEKSPAKDIYLHEKRYHTDHQGNSTCLQYKIHCIQKRKEPHSTQNCCKSVKNKKQTLDGPSKTGHNVIVVYVQLHT